MFFFYLPYIIDFYMTQKLSRSQQANSRSLARQSPAFYANLEYIYAFATAATELILEPGKSSPHTLTLCIHDTL
jgi:hypothetical protein